MAKRTPTAAQALVKGRRAATRAARLAVPAPVSVRIPAHKGPGSYRRKAKHAARLDLW